MKRTSGLIKRINHIEELLAELKQELQDLHLNNENTTEGIQQNEVKKPVEKGFFKEGEKVVILNPSPGQQKFGVIIKTNEITKWVTIKTDKGSHIRRKGHNVVRRSEYHPKPTKKQYQV